MVGLPVSSQSRADAVIDQRPVLLLVDDEPVGLRALASIFPESDYELVRASSGPAAIELLETVNPDLVLLDVMMPGLDGLEVCRRIRAHPHFAEVPILLVTALDDRHSRLAGLDAGADDYIAKPFDRAEVRARVRTITRLNRFRKLREEISHSRQTMKELCDYSARQDGLRRIDKAILGVSTAGEIAAVVLPLLSDLIPYHHAAIYRYEPKGQAISLLAEEGAGLPLSNRQERLSLEDLGVEFAGRPEVLSPIVLSLEKRTRLPIVPRAIQSAGASTIMAVPLILHERLLGVLLLGARQVDFAGPTVGIAQEVGGMLSLALAHAELLESVTRGRSQLESLSRRLLQVREEEARHIARELHDEIGQCLVVLKYSLEAAQPTADIDANRAPIEDCLSLVARLMTRVRGLSLDLHPPLLDDLGLVAALQRHIGIGHQPDRSGGEPRRGRIPRPIRPRARDRLLPGDPGGADQCDSSWEGRAGGDQAES